MLGWFLLTMPPNLSVGSEDGMHITAEQFVQELREIFIYLPSSLYGSTRRSYSNFNESDLCFLFFILHSCSTEDEVDN